MLVSAVNDLLDKPQDNRSQQHPPRCCRLDAASADVIVITEFRSLGAIIRYVKRVELRMVGVAFVRVSDDPPLLN